MKIKLLNRKRATEEDIQRTEAKLGFPLPESLKAFVRENDGAKAENNIIRVHGKMNYNVHEFLPARDMADERQYIENLPPMAYPFAYDCCGNFFFINEAKGGEVCFWDHETAEIIRVADNFETFLSMLEPDTRTIELDPGQVISVWTNPDFEDFLKKYEKDD